MYVPSIKIFTGSGSGFGRVPELLRVFEQPYIKFFYKKNQEKNGCNFFSDLFLLKRMVAQEVASGLFVKS